MATARSILTRAYVLGRNGKDWVIAKIVFAVLDLLKLLPANAAIDFTEMAGRRIGMLLPRTKQARVNIKASFPEKSAREIDTILREMWGSLSRTAAEYNYLDKIFDFDYRNPDQGRFEIAGSDIFASLIDDGKPAVFFTSHTANWEILPVGAMAYGVEITALFRPPNNRYIAKRLLAARRTKMGHLVPSKAGASWALADVLEKNGKVGVLVDQYFHRKRGTRIDFLGRITYANPLLGKLVRHFDCPVYPARCIRLPGGRFRLELQPAIDVPRKPDGSVDANALTQKVNDVVAQWVAEYPGQWLWLHNRWRYRPSDRPEDIYASPDRSTVSL